MITEDYVSFEIAKLLKEKGFDDIDCECHGWIGRSGKHYSADDTFYDTEELEKTQEDRKDFIPLITLQMAMKWLREIHDIFIEISVNEMFKDKGYQWALYYNSTKEIRPYSGWGNSYEEACEAAIKYYIEHLIK